MDTIITCLYLIFTFIIIYKSCYQLKYLSFLGASYIVKKIKNNKIYKTCNVRKDNKCKLIYKT